MSSCVQMVCVFVGAVSIPAVWLKSKVIMSLV